MIAYIVSFKYNVFWFFTLLATIFNSNPMNHNGRIRVAYIGDALNSKVANAAFLTGVSTRFLFKAKFIDITKIDSDHREIELRNSDYVIIQGGNTNAMLQFWQTSEFNKTLEQLRKDKKMPIIIGISAGSYWMFKSGISDSVPGVWDKLDGYDWIHNNIVYHADETELRRGKTRREAFIQAFKWERNIILNNNQYIRIEYQ